MKHRKKILVTGGAGFIGTNLIKKLSKYYDPQNIICLDNFSTGQKSNAAMLEQQYGVEVIRHDIIQPIDLEVEQIYNLACPASPPSYQIDPIRTMEINVVGTLNLLRLAERNQARFFQASTSEVYGDPMVHPQTEDYWGNVNPNGIRSCYDEGKRAAETLCMDFYRQKGLQVRIARIFNTYGPAMDPKDGRVVSNFVMQALRNEPITIYGSGNQTRSFCYVDDLVNGIFGLMEKEGDLVGPINLGNPNEMSMNDLAQKIIALTNSSSKIEYHPLPKDDPEKRKPNIEKAFQELAWQPQVTLENGLAPTIEYFSQFTHNNESSNFVVLSKATQSQKAHIL